MNTQELLSFIVSIAEDFKAADIKVLKVSEVCSFADYFVIMSGTSTVHIQSICEEISYKCKHAGRPPADVEGLGAGEWCLLDFGDIVVHVFLPKKRSFYDLEALWKDAEEVTAPRLSKP